MNRSPSRLHPGTKCPPSTPASQQNTRNTQCNSLLSNGNSNNSKVFISDQIRPKSSTRNDEEFDEDVLYDGKTYEYKTGQVYLAVHKFAGTA